MFMFTTWLKHWMRISIIRWIGWPIHSCHFLVDSWTNWTWDRDGNYAWVQQFGPTLIKFDLDTITVESPTCKQQWLTMSFNMASFFKVFSQLSDGSLIQLYPIHHGRDKVFVFTEIVTYSRYGFSFPGFCQNIICELRKFLIHRHFLPNVVLNLPNATPL